MGHSGAMLSENSIACNYPISYAEIGNNEKVRQTLETCVQFIFVMVIKL